MSKHYVLRVIKFLFFALIFVRVSAQTSSGVNPQVKDPTGNSGMVKTRYFKPASLIIPGAFVIYVGLKPVVSGIRDLDNNIMSSVMARYPDFHTNAADYLMWAPTASIYTFDAFKMKTTHNFKDHLILDAGSILVTGGAGFVMRKIAAHIPSYSNKGTEFPSGHTANAFRGAEIVHQELRYTHPVWSYSGYLVATSVGLLRIYNKNHLFTEVLAGAALGILSTKATYWLFDKFNHPRTPKNVAIH